VCGWRKGPEGRVDSIDGCRRCWPIAFISRATGVRLNDYGCSLKVFRSEVVKPLRLYGEMHRFLPALASELGVRIGEQAVNHRPRIHGRSKYGISRTVRVVLDLLTVKFLLSYSTRAPGRCSAWSAGPWGWPDSRCSAVSVSCVCWDWLSLNRHPAARVGRDPPGVLWRTTRDVWDCSPRCRPGPITNHRAKPV
jgi:hypothetical protein